MRTSTDVEKKLGGLGEKLESSIYSNVVGGTEGESYIALADYTDSDADRLNFKQGQLLMVTTKDDNGWWFARHGDKEGWVPSNYLKQ